MKVTKLEELQFLRTHVFRVVNDLEERISEYTEKDNLLESLKDDLRLANKLFNRVKKAEENHDEFQIG